MLEAQSVLHPPDASRSASLFLDTWHPGPEGDQRLAEALARCLLEKQML